MIFKVFLLFFIIFIIFSVGVVNLSDIKKDINSLELNGNILDYYSKNPILERRVNEIVASMDDVELAGQVIMPSWEKNMSKNKIKEWICKQKIGGFMILRNDVSRVDIDDMQRYAKECGNTLDLFVSIDAEPSLINWKFRLPELVGISRTMDLKTSKQVEKDAEKIHRYLREIGVNMNFAPVVDSADNTTIINDRSFGGGGKHIREMADVFSRNAIKNNIVPTIKHFPGHGAAVGDTHKTLEAIPGSLPELDNFRPISKWNTPLVMVGHLVIDGGEYDTKGMPATLSSIALDKLLRDELGFDGVVITDSMGMGAVTKFKNREVKALKAGIDIVLMPKDIKLAHSNILNKIKSNADFKKQIILSVKRIVKLKLAQKWSVK